MAILMMQCFPAARSITFTRVARRFTDMDLTRMRQCSYVAVGLSFPAASAPQSAMAFAARNRPSRHSRTLSSRSASRLNRSLFATGTGVKSIPIPWSRKDFLLPVSFVSSLFPCVRAAFRLRFFFPTSDVSYRCCSCRF